MVDSSKDCVYMVGFPYEPKTQSYVCVLCLESCRDSACCPHQSMPGGPIVVLDVFAERLDVSVVNPREAAF